jgi:hypothetical protein
MNGLDQRCLDHESEVTARATGPSAPPTSSGRGLSHQQDLWDRRSYARIGDRGIGNFILFLTAGLFIFQLTRKSTIDGAPSIMGNKGLLKAVNFPRAMLLVTGAVTEMLAGLSSFVVLFGIVEREHPAHPAVVVSAVVWSIVLAVGGFLHLKAAEQRCARAGSRPRRGRRQPAVVNGRDS